MRQARFWPSQGTLIKRYYITIPINIFELIQYIRGKAQVSWKMQNNPYGRKGFNGKKVEALAEAFKF